MIQDALFRDLSHVQLLWPMALCCLPTHVFLLFLFYGIFHLFIGFLSWWVKTSSSFPFGCLSKTPARPLWPGPVVDPYLFLEVSSSKNQIICISIEVSCSNSQTPYRLVLIHLIGPIICYCLVWNRPLHFTLNGLLEIHATVLSAKSISSWSRLRITSRTAIIASKFHTSKFSHRYSWGFSIICFLNSRSVLCIGS